MFMSSLSQMSRNTGSAAAAGTARLSRQSTVRSHGCPFGDRLQVRTLCQRWCRPSANANTPQIDGDYRRPCASAHYLLNYVDHLHQHWPPANARVIDNDVIITVPACTDLKLPEMTVPILRLMVRVLCDLRPNR